MRKFITLTSVHSEQNTYVQPDVITSIEPMRSNENIITLVRTNDTVFSVTETSDEVMKLIEEAHDHEPVDTEIMTEAKIEARKRHPRIKGMGTTSDSPLDNNR